MLQNNASIRLLFDFTFALNRQCILNIFESQWQLYINFHPWLHSFLGYSTRSWTLKWRWREVFGRSTWKNSYHTVCSHIIAFYIRSQYRYRSYFANRKSNWSPQHQHSTANYSRILWDILSFVIWNHCQPRRREKRDPVMRWKFASQSKMVSTGRCIVQMFSHSLN